MAVCMDEYRTPVLGRMVYMIVWWFTVYVETLADTPYPYNLLLVPYSGSPRTKTPTQFATLSKAGESSGIFQLVSVS